MFAYRRGKTASAEKEVEQRGDVLAALRRAVFCCWWVLPAAGGERRRWLLVWSVLGGRRPGNGAAGGGTFGRVTGAPPAVGWLVGSRGEEVGGGFGGLPRGKTEKRCGEWGG